MPPERAGYPARLPRRARKRQSDAVKSGGGALETPDRLEIDRGAHIEQEPGDDLAVLDIFADMGSGARRTFQSTRRISSWNW